MWLSCGRTASDSETAANSSEQDESGTIRTRWRIWPQNLRVGIILFLLVAAGSGALLDGCGTAGPARAALVASANSANFGNVLLGQTAQASISLTNTESSALQLSGIQVTGSSFSVSGDSSAPVTLPANGTYSLTIQFAPTSAGAQTGTLLLTSNQSAAGPVKVTLTGTGEPTASGPDLSAGAATVAFGNVTLNTSATQSVQLTSSGTAALTITGATVAGDGFLVTDQGFPITLEPGAVSVLNIQFNPATVGSADGSVTVTSNATTGAAKTILLSGVGTNPVYAVQLEWAAADNSSDPTQGYQIYRSSALTPSFQLLNPVLSTSTTYIDSTINSGTTYQYYVVSVDSFGQKSAPSNLFSVTVP